MADLIELHDALFGNVRGHPVGISLFHGEIPEAYKGEKVDPCAIVRLAMDDEKICYIDGTYQDCMTGAFTAGVHEATAEIRSGQYLAKNIPAMSDLAAARGKAGNFVLPQGMLRAVGAAPLNNVPDGVELDWICVVCNPLWANWIGSARSVIDGTPPQGAAGSSFCSELFSIPWHTDNVVITPGDMGGRMNNRLKPEEMFVIVPIKYADSLFNIVTVSIEGIDARATLEATRPPDSAYWDKRKRKAEKAAAKAKKDSRQESDDKPSLSFSMAWDDEAEQLIRNTPAGIIDVAVTTIEDFAQENGYDLITRAVLIEQMSSIGMDLDSLLK